MDVQIKEEPLDDSEEHIQFDTKQPPGPGTFIFPKFKAAYPAFGLSIQYSEFPFKVLRPMSCEVGILSYPHGSVKLYQGDTCVLAGVFGPTEVRLSKELPHRGAVDVLYRPKVTGTSQLQAPVMDPILSERSLESIIVSIFETSIHLEKTAGMGYNIILHEIEDDGSLLSCCINASTISLLDGGCSLRHNVGAVTMILTKNNHLIIDPCSKQMKQDSRAKFTFVFSNDLSLLYCNAQGHFKSKEFQVIQTFAIDAVKELFEYYQFIVFKKDMIFKEVGKSEPDPINSVDLSKIKIQEKEEEDEEGEISN